MTQFVQLEALPAAPDNAGARPRSAALRRAVIHRLDAWGVAWLVAALAAVVHHAVDSRALLLATAIGAMYAFAYALNDFFDAPYDAQDARKARTNPFARGLIGRRHAVAAAWASLLGLALAFAPFGPVGIASLALFLFVAWAYSSPPLRLKRRPGIDLVTHAVFVQSYPYLVTVLLLDGAWGRADGALLAVNFLASLSGQLAQQRRDFAVDSRTDTNFTTAVGLGPALVLQRLATVGIMVVVVLGVVTGAVPPALAPIAVIALPRFALRLSADRDRPYAKGLAAGTVAAALLYMAGLLAYGWGAR